MVILMDTIAIAGGVHSVSLYEQALKAEQRPIPPARIFPAREPSHMRRAASAGLFALGIGLQRLSRKVCDECRAGTNLRTGQASVS